MAKNTTYRITISNWKKYNETSKAGHLWIKLSKRFFDDEKISQLRQNEVLLYLKLLLIGGDLVKESFEIHKGMMPKCLRIDDRMMVKCLDSLQLLQLLSYEIKPPLYNIREEKGKEEKLNSQEVKQLNDFVSQLEPAAIKKRPPDFSEENRKIKNAYLDAFRIRYGVEPSVQSAQFNGQVANLRKKLGTDVAVAVVKFFMTHNDGYYLKNTHSFGLCLKDAETLFVQMQKGKAITSRDVRQVEQRLATQDLLRMVDEGKI